MYLIQVSPTVESSSDTRASSASNGSSLSTRAWESSDGPRERILPPKHGFKYLEDRRISADVYPNATPQTYSSSMRRHHLWNRVRGSLGADSSGAAS